MKRGIDFDQPNPNATPADQPASDARRGTGFEPIGEVAKRIVQRLKDKERDPRNP